MIKLMPNAPPVTLDRDVGIVALGLSFDPKDETEIDLWGPLWSRAIGELQLDGKAQLNGPLRMIGCHIMGENRRLRLPIWARRGETLAFTLQLVETDPTPVHLVLPPSCESFRISLLEARAFSIDEWNRAVHRILEESKERT